MKILQLVTRRQYRGAEVFAANLSKELIKDGVSIVFVGLYKPSKIVLDVDGAQNIDLNGNPSSTVSLSLLSRLNKIIYEYRPDVIQANGSDTLKYIAILKLANLKIPVIYRNISIISKWINGNILKRFIYQTLFSKIEHVSSVGDEAIEDFIRTLGYPKNKTSVIKRGIPALKIDKQEARYNLRCKLGLLDSDKVVVHAGNFSPEKNHLFLIDVFSQVSKFSSNIKLLLLGEGVLFNEIRRKIEFYGLQDTVFLWGFEEKIQEVIAGCDLFALCSTIEGVPGVILEAAAQSVPSIAINVGGVGEVVQDSVTGILIPRHDIHLFKQKLLLALDSSEQLEKLGKNANSFVLQNYNPYNNAQKFVNVYKNILKSR